MTATLINLVDYRNLLESAEANALEAEPWEIEMLMLNQQIKELMPWLHYGLSLYPIRPALRLIKGGKS